MPTLRTCLLALALGAGMTAPAQAVVGGQNADPGEYPFVAHVLIDKRFQCTGTLVTPNHVISAGHCTSLVPAGVVNVPVGQPGQLIEVSIGAYKTPKNTLLGGYQSDGEHRVGKHVSVAPGYLGVGSVSSDVVVIELDRPSTKTPVKIANAQERSIWEPGKLMTIAGFGVTKSGGKQPEILQEAQVPIVRDKVAAKAYPYLVDGVDPLFGGFESRTQVAAGYKKGGVDTCQGDSGGPLLAPIGDGFRLVGDTSYGVGCAEPDYPGVYGRVADTTLREWIRSVAPDAIAPASSTTTTGKKPRRTKKVQRTRSTSAEKPGVRALR